MEISFYFLQKKIRFFETVYTPQIRIGRLHISFLHYIHTRFTQWDIWCFVKLHVDN